MSKVLSVGMLIFIACSASSQDGSSFRRFVNAFEEGSKQRLGNFGVLVNRGKNMTKEQAIEFVYHGDTSKLYCRFQKFNMETEERGSITTEQYLPQKCLKLTTPNFILIGYLTFECNDPNKLLKEYLTLKVVDSKSFQVTDSLVTYVGSEYDWEITGLINPQNNKIFLVKELGNRNSNAQALIYGINAKMQFEIEKQQNNSKNMTDNLEKDIELLGWGEAFLH